MTAPRATAIANLPKRGPGRPKGSVNRYPERLRTVILGALDKVGGLDYLARQAEENPVAFMSLLGKVLPMTVQSDPNAPLQITIERRVLYTPDS